MSDEKHKVVDPVLLRMVGAFCVEIFVVTVAFFVIVSLTWGINAVLLEMFAGDPKNEQYLFIFKAAKWVVLVIDLIAWIVFTGLFALKLIFQIADDELPKSLHQWSYYRLGFRGSYIFESFKSFTDKQEALLVYRTERSGKKVWAKAIYTESTRFGGGDLRVLKRVEPYEDEDDITREAKCEVETYALADFFLLMGRAGTTDTKHSMFIGVFRYTTRCWDRERAGILFHEKGNTEVRAYSPAFIVPKESRLIEVIDNTTDRPSIIEDEQIINALDSSWREQIAFEGLIPPPHIAQFCGTWIYYFKDFKKVSVYGVFQIALSGMDEASAHGRAWHFGKKNGRPNFRGVWESDHLSVNGENRSVALVYKMKIKNIPDHKADGSEMGAVARSDVSATPNPGPRQQNPPELEYTGHLTFWFKEDDKEQLEGLITNLNGEGELSRGRVEAARVEKLSIKDVKADTLEQDFRNKLEVEIFDSGSKDPDLEIHKDRVFAAPSKSRVRLVASSVQHLCL